jgi:hypothetical protein
MSSNRIGLVTGLALAGAALGGYGSGRRNAYEYDGEMPEPEARIIETRSKPTWRDPAYYQTAPRDHVTSERPLTKRQRRRQRGKSA